MTTLTFTLPPSAVGVLGLDDAQLRAELFLTLLPAGRSWTFESSLYAALIVLDDLDERADAGSGFDETAESRGYARKGAASLRKQIAEKTGTPAPARGRVLAAARAAGRPKHEAAQETARTALTLPTETTTMQKTTNAPAMLPDSSVRDMGPARVHAGENDRRDVDRRVGPHFYDGAERRAEGRDRRGAAPARVHPLDTAGEALASAKGWVAQSVLENRRVLEFTLDAMAGGYRMDVQSTQDAREALSEILEALRAWDDASETFLRTLHEHTRKHGPIG